MRRRAALQVLGSAAAIPAAIALTPHDAFALARDIHERLATAGHLPLEGLSESRKQVLAVVADVIIPATDTPGARAARVHDFIDVVYAEWMTDRERAQFEAAIDAFDERSRAAHGVAFADATAAQRLALVTTIDAEAFAPDAPRSPRPPYRRLKELVLHGYYTSRIGQEQELRQRIVPGTYDGCRPVPARAGGDA